MWNVLKTRSVLSPSKWLKARSFTRRLKPSLTKNWVFLFTMTTLALTLENLLKQGCQMDIKTVYCCFAWDLSKMMSHKFVIILTLSPHSHLFMSPVSAVFHTVVTVRIGLKRTQSESNLKLTFSPPLCMTSFMKVPHIKCKSQKIKFIKLYHGL